MFESGDDQLFHVEGTIILHVVFAIKQDPDLARELIKYVKVCNIKLQLYPIIIKI